MGKSLSILQASVFPISKVETIKHFPHRVVTRPNDIILEKDATQGLAQNKCSINVTVIVIIWSKKDCEAATFRKEKKCTWKEMRGSPTSKQPAGSMKSTKHVLKGSKGKIAKVTKFYISLFMI